MSASSMQFLLLDWPAAAVREVLRRCAARGVELKWFGAAEPAGFTSRYDILALCAACNRFPRPTGCWPG